MHSGITISIGRSMWIAKQKKNDYLSRHMAMHLFVMHKYLKQITNMWITMIEFVPFGKFTRDKIIDSALKDLPLNVTPKIFWYCTWILTKTFEPMVYAPSLTIDTWWWFDPCPTFFCIHMQTTYHQYPPWNLLLPKTSHFHQYNKVFCIHYWIIVNTRK